MYFQVYFQIISYDVLLCNMKCRKIHSIFYFILLQLIIYFDKG